MKKNSLRFVSAPVIVSVVIISLALTCVLFTASCSFLRQLSSVQQSAGEENNFGIDEILKVVSERYIGDSDSEEMITAAKRAIIDSLDDQWSYYMTPEEFTAYMESSDNTYRGIGVEVLISEDNEGIEVTNVYDNSGAKAAGIVAGDIITAIDGESISGYSIFDVRIALRREIGDTVQLTVLRAGGVYAEITVEYNVIFRSPVSYELIDENIGYILLSNFEGGSADAFIEAVNLLIKQGADAFIFDVRSNYGGRVTEMTAILDHLLPEGIIFISVDESGNEEIITSGSDFIDLPAAVLVNSHSYSGAEYFTATLSEYGYAITVGEPTTGKNRMQQTIRLSDGGAVHISTGMFLTPNHVDLYEQGGYTPDYVVEFTDEQSEKYYRGELTHDEDPQFQKAAELLG